MNFSIREKNCNNSCGHVQKSDTEYKKYSFDRHHNSGKRKFLRISQ